MTKPNGIILFGVKENKGIQDLEILPQVLLHYVKTNFNHNTLRVIVIGEDSSSLYRDPQNEHPEVKKERSVDLANQVFKEIADQKFYMLCYDEESLSLGNFPFIHPNFEPWLIRAQKNISFLCLLDLLNPSTVGKVCEKGIFVASWTKNPEIKLDNALDDALEKVFKNKWKSIANELSHP